MQDETKPIWIKWQVGGLANTPMPQVGQRIPITEQYLYDDEGNTVGTTWIDPVPGIVEKIGAHWSNQPEGRSGYWVYVEPLGTCYFCGTETAVRAFERNKEPKCGSWCCECRDMWAAAVPYTPQSFGEITREGWEQGS